MTDERTNEATMVDADTSGHLAMALFIAVIMVMLGVIYALATAA